MFKNTKIYNDGSHYIAIPYSTNNSTRNRHKEIEEIIVVEEKLNNNMNKGDVVNAPSFVQMDSKSYVDEETGEVLQKEELPKINRIKVEKRVKITHVFDKEYIESSNMTKSERKTYLNDVMRRYFNTDKEAQDFVDNRLEMKKRNLICRKVRFMRKANLHEFNYFVTFTYDNKKHNEDSFKKKLSKCLRNLAVRKEWRYIGVWERSPTGRLHFHGMIYIPSGKMVGELILVKDFSLATNKIQDTMQNTYFNDKFGRSDFSELNKNEQVMSSAKAYLIKYIEKTGEKIIYSRGLPTYLVSDIKEEDVVCRIGQEEKKLLLFDNFKCYTDGEYIGEMRTETLLLVFVLSKRQCYQK